MCVCVCVCVCVRYMHHVWILWALPWLCFSGLIYILSQIFPVALCALCFLTRLSALSRVMSWGMRNRCVWTAWIAPLSLSLSFSPPPPSRPLWAGPAELCFMTKGMKRWGWAEKTQEERRRPLRTSEAKLKSLPFVLGARSPRCCRHHGVDPQLINRYVSLKKWKASQKSVKTSNVTPLPLGIGWYFNLNASHGTITTSVECDN